MVCQELLRGYKRKNVSVRCLMKVDLRKVRDSVHQEFADDVLKGLLLPSVFRGWIMSCVRGRSFSLCISRTTHGVLKGSRGIRQQDHISPLLFVIIVEYFSTLLMRATNDASFNFHLGCKSIRLSHMFFS